MDIRGKHYFVMAGSCLDRLTELADESVDAVVTDPPYELGFMGKKWDNSGIAFDTAVWSECLRVLKPGGHILAFGGTRTWHRIAVAIEDAGFEIRDSFAWLYGSGFPKSMNIGKAIDKAAGANIFVGKGFNVAGQGIGLNQNKELRSDHPNYVKPSGITDEAKQWDGWGTALKPAFEPIIMGRKPLAEKTIAANVLKYGTGAINVDGSRIAAGDENFDNLKGRPIQKLATRRADESDDEYRERVLESPSQQAALDKLKNLGRWPANVLLDEFTAKLVDEQSGVTKSPKPYEGDGYKDSSMFSIGGVNHANEYGDKGGASRFFYVSKANKKDRNEGDVANTHPTVKPTNLMEYLIKLVTQPGGTVLDPFTGSGSTGKAALLNGYKFIGVELTEEYLPIIQGRLEHAEEKANINEGLF